MPAPPGQRVGTGIPGLDEITRGGYLAGRSTMVRGGPGVGKTALGLHFLVEGVRRGESAVFLTHAIEAESILADAASMGLDAGGIRFVDFTPSADFFSESQSYDVFSPAEVERESFTSKLVAEIEAARPTRVFLDALTQVRHLSADLIDFRRQAQSFLRFLTANGATVVFASGSSGHGETDEDLQFMADGVVNLDYSPALGRTVTISKLRGSGFQLGKHSARIDDAGFHVYPRLVPERFAREVPPETIGSGLDELDLMLGGGVERGSVTLISGPTGVGKTTLATQFLADAAAHGERGVVYTFEESTSVLLRRSEGVGLPVRAQLDDGRLAIAEIEPLHYTPDQFALEVRREVEERDARLVMIDSTAGYRVSLQGEDLVAHLHSLCAYLRNMGATVLLLHEVSQITGEFRATDAEVSYLADNILFLRYVELGGELRRVVGVLKKRTSDFQKTLRELTITGDGLVVGEPLAGFRGILSGLPVPTTA